MAPQRFAGVPLRGSSAVRPVRHRRLRRHPFGPTALAVQGGGEAPELYVRNEVQLLRSWVKRADEVCDPTPEGGVHPSACGAPPYGGDEGTSVRSNT